MRRRASLLSIPLACLLLLMSPNWKPDQDSVAYLSMARSFAAGRGMLHLGLHQWHYAPFYSVIISPVFWFDGRPFLRISLINIATAWALVLGTFLWFKRYAQRGAGLIAALVGVNIGLWDVCREPRSETLFSALLIWAAACFAGALRSKTISRFCLCTVVGALITLAAVLTRQVGIFLAAGFTVAILIRWWRGGASPMHLLISLVPGLLAAVAVIALVARDHHAATLDRVPVVITYTEQFRQGSLSIFAQLLDGIRRQTADVGRLLLPGMWGSFAHFGEWLNVNTILYVLLTIPVSIGWWQLTRRTADPLLCSVPFYTAMFTVWPYDQGTRFNVPMLPVLWASVWMMLGRWPRQRVLILTILLALHLIASLCYLIGDDVKVARWNETIPPMADLAQHVTNHQPVAAIGGAPNDILIWRYLLDRPVRNLSKKESPSSDTNWLFQSKTTTVQEQFLPVASSTEIILCRRER